MSGVNARVTHSRKKSCITTETRFRTPRLTGLIATLNSLIRDTPMAAEEKLLVVVWTKLVELLAAIEDGAQRKRYVNRITALLNQDIVEAARAAFAEIK